MLYNPYRNYDKGMDDAYMGIEPQDTTSQQYMEGYELSQQLLEQEEQQQEQSPLNPTYHAKRSNSN